MLPKLRCAARAGAVQTHIPMHPIVSASRHHLIVCVTAASRCRSVHVGSCIGNAETLALCGEINQCSSVDDVVRHYKANDTRYDVLNHIAALNAVAVRDPLRKASGAALPHVTVLEKFLPPILHQLAPRETATVCYLFAVYGHQMNSKMHRLLSSHLVKQMETMEINPEIRLVWNAPRQTVPNAWTNLTTIPQECFSALHGPSYPRTAPQDAALAAWALARQLIYAHPIFKSLAAEIVDWMQKDGNNTAGFTHDSLLRVAWACAKAGYSQAELVDRIATMTGERTGLQSAASDDHYAAFSYEQQALLLWSLSVLDASNTVTAALADRIFSREALEERKDTCTIMLQQQLYQTYHLLKSKHAKSAALERALPDWLWQTGNKSAAPKEDDPYDMLYEEISKMIKRLGFKHSRQYGVDGYSIDIAFPAIKFGIEVVNKIAAIKSAHALAAAPAGSIKRGHHSNPISSTAASAIDILDPIKLTYLTSKGWQVNQLDYGQWRIMSPANRLEYLSKLLQPLS